MEHLPKKIHQNGISYTLVGDYYIPDLKLPEESRLIGRWGRMHKAFLQEHRPGQYNVLLLCSMLPLSLGTLNGCGAKSADTAISAETDKDMPYLFVKSSVALNLS